MKGLLVNSLDLTENSLGLLVSNLRLANKMVIEANSWVIACNLANLDYSACTVQDFVHHVETKRD